MAPSYRVIVIFIIGQAAKNEQGTNLRFFEKSCGGCEILMKILGQMWYNVVKTFTLCRWDIPRRGMGPVYIFEEVQL